MLKMRLIVYSLPVILLIVFVLSCNDEVKLYHPLEEPEVRWLLKTVDYPADNPGFTSRLDPTFFYTDDEQVMKITNPGTVDSLLKIDYKPNEVAVSRLRRSGTTTTYDSLILKLNDKKQTEYALHVTYSQWDGGAKVKSNDDSTTFVYDAAGYLVQFDRYSYTGNSSSLSHTEKRTIVDGIITDIEISSGLTTYKYTYTYDDREYADPAKYCYEMPYNTALSGCWLFTNMPFLTEYFGKGSKNNVVRAVAERTMNGNTTPYGDVTYQYTFDENNLVTKVEMSGTSRNNVPFKGLVISFSYYKKEIY
jgi:hypothetical protein